MYRLAEFKVEGFSIVGLVLLWRPLSYGCLLAALNVFSCLQKILDICVVLRLFAIFAMYFCFCLHVDLFCWMLCRIVFSRCLEICKTLETFAIFCDRLRI